jgi:signal transduction histidine kinase
VSRDSRAVPAARERARELARLAEHEFGSFSEAARAVVSLAQRLLQMEILCVTEVRDGRYLFLDVERSIPVPVAAGAELPWNQALCYAHIEFGAPPVNRDIRDQPLYWAAWLRLKNALQLDWDVRGFVTVPIRQPDGRLFGTLCAHNTSPLDVDESARETLLVLARILGYEISRERGRVALEEAHRELQASERRRIELVGEVAHELRAPLMVIDGYMEGIIDGVVPPGGEALQLVRGEAQRVRRLVDDLEQLVRLGDVGSDPFHPEPVDVARVAADAVARFAPLAAAHDITLQAQAADDLVVPGERDRLDQAVANLVRNAIGATQAGGTVEVVAARGESAALLRVRDTGVGMPADEAERAFDRFFRGRTGRDRYEGSGLGLAIVRSIAARHGGSARLESEAGRGTEVTLELPLG